MSYKLKLYVFLFAAIFGGIVFSYGCAGDGGRTGVPASDLRLDFDCVSGSGTAEDPCNVVKGSEVSLGATDEDGDPVDMDWTLGDSAAGSTSEKSSGAGDESIGAVLGSIFTAADPMGGCPVSTVTGCERADPDACITAYLRLVVGDEFTFSDQLIYETRAEHEITDGGAIAASGCKTNIAMSNAVIPAEGEGFAPSWGFESEMLTTYSEDLSDFSTPSAILPDENRFSYSQGTPMMFKMDDEKYGIIWNSRKTGQVWDMFFASGTFGSNELSDPVNITSVSGSATNYNVQQDVKVDSDGVIHLLWVNLTLRPTEGYDEDRTYDTTYYSKSSDGGETWGEPVTLNGLSDPELSGMLAIMTQRMVVDSDGTVHVVQLMPSVDSYIFGYCKVTSAGCRNTADIFSEVGITDTIIPLGEGGTTALPQVFSLAIDGDDTVYIMFANADVEFDADGAIEDVNAAGIYVTSVSSDGQFGSLGKVSNLPRDPGFVSLSDGRLLYDSVNDSLIAIWSTGIRTLMQPVPSSGIYWSQSKNGGRTWGDPQTIVEAPGFGQIGLGQAIVDDSGRILMMYDYGSSDEDAFSIKTNAYLVIGQ
jgi:hypothetical protein